MIIPLFTVVEMYTYERDLCLPPIPLHLPKKVCGLYDITLLIWSWHADSEWLLHFILAICRFTMRSVFFRWCVQWNASTVMTNEVCADRTITFTVLRVCHCLVLSVDFLEIFIQLKLFCGTQLVFVFDGASFTVF